MPYGLLAQGTAANPGEARNIPHGAMYDIARALQGNQVGNFLFSGLADWLMTTAKGGKTSYGQNLMAGLDSMLPGMDDALLKVAPGLLGMTAWHGSPHLFNKFDLSKIGTGEGAQAYGYGLYFAENPAVAKEYLRLAGPEAIEIGGRNIKELGLSDDARKLVEQATFKAQVGHSSIEKEIGMLREHAEKFAGKNAPAYREAADALGRGAQRGNLYKVDIPDSAIDNMLDWDKPLSEQPESVRKALAGLRLPDVATGQQIYDALKNRAMSALEPSARYGLETYAKDASEQLRKMGIPGIKYLDQGSRAGGNGTRNFVVFDDSLVTIKGRE